MEAGTTHLIHSGINHEHWRATEIPHDLISLLSPLKCLCGKQRLLQLLLQSEQYLQLIVIPSSTPLFLGNLTWKVPLLGMTDSIKQKTNKKEKKGEKKFSVAWMVSLEPRKQAHKALLYWFK